MQVAFLIPTTSSGRAWKSPEDSYLHKFVLQSLSAHLPPGISLVFYVGFDVNDPFYKSTTMRLAIESLHPEVRLRWEGFTPDPGNVTRIWNGLARLALEDQCTYFMVGGDDIVYPPDKEWLHTFIHDLQANHNIGWISGFSGGNSSIATQFFLHRTHMEMLGWVFPPQIRNWYCDDFLNQVYPEKYRVWHKHVPMPNSGGPERYTPNNHRALCDQLVARHRNPLARSIAERVASAEPPPAACRGHGAQK